MFRGGGGGCFETWDSAAYTWQIGEAYQVLSDDQLRANYDKYGKEGAVPQSGFGKITQRVGVKGGLGWADKVGRGSVRVLYYDFWW